MSLLKKPGFEFWGGDAMNRSLTHHDRFKVKEIMLWGLAEITLSLTGFDQIAAYSEYLQAHNLSAYGIASEMVEIITTSFNEGR
jgi:hypothetical protein